jgi:hypothetical protein
LSRLPLFAIRQSPASSASPDSKSPEADDEYQDEFQANECDITLRTAPAVLNRINIRSSSALNITYEDLVKSVAEYALSEPP